MKRAIVLVVLLTACSSAHAAAPTTVVVTHPPLTTTFRLEQQLALDCIEAVEGAYLSAEQRWSVDVAGLRSACGGLTAYGPGGIGRQQQQSIADIGHLVDALNPGVLPLAVTAPQRAAAFATLQSARGAFALTGR